jgi:hypothetical protein
VRFPFITATSKKLSGLFQSFFHLSLLRFVEPAL